MGKTYFVNMGEFNRQIRKPLKGLSDHLSSLVRYQTDPQRPVRIRTANPTTW